MVPILLLRVFAQRPIVLQAIDKAQRAAATKQVGSPHCIVFQREFSRQPMQVVIVDVESLLGIRASAASERCVQDLPVFRRRPGFGDDDNDLRVGLAPLEQPTH